MNFQLQAGPFPESSTVGLYAASQFVSGREAPLGNPIATGTVSGSEIIIGPVSAGRTYYVAAQVSGTWRKIQIEATPPPTDLADVAHLSTDNAFSAENDFTVGSVLVAKPTDDANPVRRQDIGGIVGQMPPPSGDNTGGTDSAALDAVIASVQAIGTTGRVMLAEAPYGNPYFFNADHAFPIQIDLEGPGSSNCFCTFRDGARFKFGGEVGGAVDLHGEIKGFTIDGVGTGSPPSGKAALHLNTNLAKHSDIIVKRVDGDGMAWLGQNGGFDHVGVLDNNGHGWVLDNGCGHADVSGSCQSSFNSGYNVEIRKSGASTAGAYVIPTSNIFVNFLAEHCGSSTFGTSNAGLGSVHQTAGSYNRFITSELHNASFTGTAISKAAVWVEGDGSANPNGRLYIQDCISTGGGAVTNTAGAIKCTGTPNADYAVVLQGRCTFSGWPEAANWQSATPLLNDSIHYEGKNHTYFSCPIFYAPSGAAASVEARTSPHDLEVLQDIYLARNFFQQGGYRRLVEIATPAAPPANMAIDFARDDGAGKTEYGVEFGSGEVHILTRDGYPGAPPEDVIAPTLLNSWVNFGSGWSDAGYYRHDGRVYLTGLIKDGTVANAAFTLPVGYRPAAGKVFVAISNGALGRVDVDSAGNVRPVTPSNNAYVCLDGMSFRHA